MRKTYNITDNLRRILAERPELGVMKLEARAHVGHSSITRALAGRRVNAHTVCNLADALGVKPSELTGEPMKRSCATRRGKPCGYARALEICGGPEYLTSSTPAQAVHQTLTFKDKAGRNKA